jgi:hypothetical protein
LGVQSSDSLIENVLQILAVPDCLGDDVAGLQSQELSGGRAPLALGLNAFLKKAGRASEDYRKHLVGQSRSKSSIRFGKKKKRNTISQEAASEIGSGFRTDETFNTRHQSHGMAEN